MITAAKLRAFAPAADLNLASILDRECKAFGITTPRRVAHFLGQISHESAGFKHVEENLNYSALRLCQVWPSRFPNAAAAASCARNPEALANNVYGGRMGNTKPGDGWLFRGRGYIQLTGRENYTKFAKITGLDLVNNPDLAAQPGAAVRIAAAYWADRGCNELADKDDISTITRKINGGQNGMIDRRLQVERAKKIWG